MYRTCPFSGYVGLSAVVPLGKPIASVFSICKEIVGFSVPIPSFDFTYIFLLNDTSNSTDKLLFMDTSLIAINLPFVSTLSECVYRF